MIARSVRISTRSFSTSPLAIVGRQGQAPLQAFRNRQNTVHKISVPQQSSRRLRRQISTSPVGLQQIGSRDAEGISTSKKMAGSDHFLTTSCPDKAGIVYAVTGLSANAYLTLHDLLQVLYLAANP